MQLFVALVFVAGCGALAYLIFASAKVEVPGVSLGALTGPPNRKSGTKAELNRLSLIARRLRMAIKVVAGMLMAGFAWLNVQNWPVSEFVRNTPASTALKVTIGLYFFSWLFGTLWEVDLFEVVYFSPPGRSKSLTKPDLASIVVLALSGGFVLYAAAIDAEGLFAIALSVFFVTNVLLWLYTVRQIVGFTQISMLTYNQQSDYCGIEQVKLMFEHARGDWQRWRFLALLVIVASLDVVTFVAPAREMISSLANAYFPSVPVATYYSLLPDIFLVSFLLVGEGWIWMARVSTRFNVEALSRLREGYKLRPLKVAK